MSGLRCRPFDQRDAKAVQRVDELALAETETDPDDIPGSGDLADVAASYLDRGGEFLVGVLPEPLEVEDSAAITTHDGSVVAIGGYLPGEAGYEDERTVPGAAELHRMRVHPAVQGQGYGRDLLAALESRITAADFDPILATTARRQRKAIAFYPSAGYEQVDESTLGEYELVHFEKRLD
ncbi:GNAT family N-acetyltransferase [Natranaeroarchaeum sulfidigenes]|uniref:Acetyltransferase (GNAT) family n=1 Tax=Natranaeroarchaeum sulfidigenes TaxID=2784880 RepID=A0A897MT70_9EURY|nr:GNAT family N-acetyltransferase [Natranaeroarchaeum sulfidigenes]QSG01396.1 Acetyltransferase (GNAT) family [Natranaeroarchaeum sulfidigenes]